MLPRACGLLCVLRHARSFFPSHLRTLYWHSIYMIGLAGAIQRLPSSGSGAKLLIATINASLLRLCDSVQTSRRKSDLQRRGNWYLCLRPPHCRTTCLLDKLQLAQRNCTLFLLKIELIFRPSRYLPRFVRLCGRKLGVPGAPEPRAHPLTL